jgi:hypothetical protein
MSADVDMRRLWSFAVLTVVGAALFTAGCDPIIYRAETVLHADGSVRRAIYQPIEATPEAVRDSSVWSGTTYAARIPHQRWSGKIDALPRAQRSDEHAYFAAWGEFRSPLEMPLAYLKPAPEGLPDGKLVVEFEREDLGLVIAYHWKETLTDIVAIDDMQRARVELADLLAPLAPKIVERALGADYDATRLRAWCDETARPWLFEVIDVLVARAGRREQSQQQTYLALAHVCERYGLVLTDSTGKLLDDAPMGARIAEYAEEVLRDGVRRRDGREAPQAVIDELLQWIGLKEPPENSQERLQDWLREPGLKKYDAAAKAVVAEQFGNEDELEKTLKPLAVRILGLYASEMFGSPHHFHYTLETPGKIVSTNGTLLADAVVRWTFSGGDAYPFGYAMECESLAAQKAIESKLLAKPALTTREAMVDYAELVRSDDNLRFALVACVAEKSMAPYYKARDAAAAASKSEQAFKALAKLLKLPEKPAGR